jgi:chemotaxis regulatin CheY-phosphate phosphatase CheZ
MSKPLKEMMKELGIDRSTSKVDRDRTLAEAWSRLNARMQAVNDPAKRAEIHQEMNLILEIRKLGGDTP